MHFRTASGVPGRVKLTAPSFANEVEVVSLGGSGLWAAFGSLLLLDEPGLDWAGWRARVTIVVVRCNTAGDFPVEEFVVCDLV